MNLKEEEGLFMLGRVTHLLKSTHLYAD
jgi:hypothetical protein